MVRYSRAAVLSVLMMNELVTTFVLIAGKV